MPKKKKRKMKRKMTKKMTKHLLKPRRKKLTHQVKKKKPEPALRLRRPLQHAAPALLLLPHAHETIMDSRFDRGILWSGPQGTTLAFYHVDPLAVARAVVF